MASSILGRIGQLVRANVNALLDQAEDPEKMLDQLIRDFTENIREAEEAVAQTIGNLRLLEDDHREARSGAADLKRRSGDGSDDDPADDACYQAFFGREPGGDGDAHAQRKRDKEHDHGCKKIVAPGAIAKGVERE